ncbi:MAG: hypothetical protein RR376_11875 [Janthinobacterium sp.]
MPHRASRQAGFFFLPYGVPHHLSPCSAGSLPASACLALLPQGCNSATPVPTPAVRMPAAMPAGW